MSKMAGRTKPSIPTYGGEPGRFDQFQEGLLSYLTRVGKVAPLLHVLYPDEHNATNSTRDLDCFHAISETLIDPALTKYQAWVMSISYSQRRTADLWKYLTDTHRGLDSEVRDHLNFSLSLTVPMKGENPVAFATTMSNMFSKYRVMEGNLEEDECVRTTIRRLPHSYKAGIFGREPPIQTYADLISYLRKLHQSERSLSTLEYSEDATITTHDTTTSDNHATVLKLDATRQNTDDVVCKRCNKPGHTSPSCPADGTRCSSCKFFGHRAKNCPASLAPTKEKKLKTFKF